MLMKNNHNIEIYDNGHGYRIAFVFQGARRILTIDQAKALKESLEYGLAKTHLTIDTADGEQPGRFRNSDENYRNGDLPDYGY